jgi:hypothetical protein
MRKWQRFWLYFLLTYSLVHLLRDIQQDLEVKTLLSTVLVKSPSYSGDSLLWSSNWTYPVEISEIILSLAALNKNKFSPLGYVTIGIALTTAALWSYYWFFL